MPCVPRAVVVLSLALGCSAAPSPVVDAGTSPDVVAVDAVALDAAPDAPPFDAAPPPDVTATDGAPSMTASLTIVVFAVPDNTPPDASLFVAGNFNAWNPADARFQLRRDARGLYTATVPDPGPSVEFKFTRGSWTTVERDDDGRDIANRRATRDPAHPVVAASIARWADLAAPASTRSGEVRVLRDVRIPQLDRARDVWVYLPRGYDASSARYPVMYMFDGQNLFDARASAFGHEWRVDEALEALTLEGRIEPMIVVGVANSAARGCEYNVFAADPHPACADGAALGDRTVAFVVDTLKPMIDAMYRTRPDRAHTGVGGSSMGGSMVVRAGATRADVFSRVAALSPSYQNTLAAAVSMPAAIRANPPPAPLRVHQDVGTREQIREIGADVIARNMLSVRDALRAAGVADDAQRALTVPDATHDEVAWSLRVGEVLQWLWSGR